MDHVAKKEFILYNFRINGPHTAWSLKLVDIYLLATEMGYRATLPGHADNLLTASKHAFNQKRTNC